MHRYSLVLAILLSLSGVTLAGELEKNVKARWLGAWIVINVESYSDCGGMYTNNRVNGTLVKSKGDHGFEPGELAKIDKIDVKRSRVDVLATVSEPLLLPYPEGPFTLYREARCKIEFEVMLLRDAVKNKNVDAVDGALAAILERHATLAQASDSDSWNGREMEHYPEDYELTLAKVAVWKAEQTNLKVEKKLGTALEETTRLGDRVNGDAVYLAGFARGVETARSNRPSDCPAMLAIDLRPGSDEQASERGFRDGQNLVHGLELLRRLPECYVPVPELPAAEIASQE
jgi:hypothetical protein